MKSFALPEFRESEDFSALKDHSINLNLLSKASMIPSTFIQSVIIMKVFGTNRPSRTLIDLLNNTIEDKLISITIKKIAEAFFRSQSTMTKED